MLIRYCTRNQHTPPCAAEPAVPQFDLHLLESDQPIYSLLFCGIGDARHLFTTLAWIRIHGTGHPTLAQKGFRLTLVDTNVAALARVLLVIRMLLDCARESARQREVTLAAIAFTFAAQVMPSWVYDRLQTAIADLDAELIHGGTRFYANLITRSRVCYHLHTWQRAPQSWYSTASILLLTRQALERRSLNFQEERWYVPRLPGCNLTDLEVLEFVHLNFMAPHPHLLTTYEPRLGTMLAAYRETQSLNGKQELGQYVQSNWKPNITLIDFY